MESLWGEWILIIINAIILTLVITTPFLVGILLIGVLRKRLNEDRQGFEEELMAKLSVIQAQLDELRKGQYPSIFLLSLDQELPYALCRANDLHNRFCSQRSQ